MKCKTIVAIACFIGANVAPGQNYSGYLQSSTPNFQVGTTDANGRIVVNADWNTASTAQPDFFQGATGTSYNLTFGPNANLYNCGLVNGSAFNNFTDSPPASLPFVIQDATAGQATGSIAYSASAATVQAAIRASLTANWPQATVTQDGSTYQVANGAPGAKPLLSVSISSSVVQGFVAETRTGNASQPEVQTLTIQSTHYLFTIDGTSTLPSLVTNEGVLNVLPPTPSNQTTSEIAFIQNATFINNGILGNFDNTVNSDSTAPWVLMHMGPNGHFVNNGVVSCCQGPYCGQTIFSASVENSGVIRTKWGASMEGAGLMNNYSTGGLVQESPDSYGIQLYGGFDLNTRKAVAGNWGYITAWTQGVYLAQPYSQFDDYGGPLEPGQMIYSPRYTPVDPNSSDYQFDLAYGGSIGASYDSSAPGTNDTNSGGLGAAIVSESAVYGNTLSVNLHNRVDTVQSSTDGATPVGTLVNFMPILYGDIAGVNLNNSNIVTLYFDDLTSDQVQTINSAITAGTRLFDSNSTKNTVTAKFTIGGVQYATQNIGQVVLAANKNPNIPVPTTTPIGVYSGSLASPQFYSASSLQNPTTITLTGTGTPLKTGNLNIEAGWSLRLGKLTKQPNPVSGGSAGPWVGTNDYTASLANCTGIEIDNGTSTSTGYSIDGVVQGSQTHELPGNLVVDNFSTPLVLPPLIGSGNFVQEGASTTTVNTDRFKGALYIPHGTLKMAQGTSMSQVRQVLMQSKDASRFASSLDVSLAAATTPFAGSSFSAGIVLPNLIATLPVSCFNVNDAHYLFPPVINLGSNNLVVGNGTGQTSSLFQGQIQGTGGLEVAPGTTLTLGGSVASDNTYSGNTYVDAGATLLFSTFPLNTSGQALRMCGTGNLVNFGTIQTTSGNPQLGANANSPVTPQNAAGAGANHVIYVNGNYTQGTGGNLVLNVNSAILASGGTPAAPGIASDYLNVGGTLTLGSDAYLTLNDVQPTALTQASTIVIAQAGSGTLGGANVFTSGTTGVPLYEGTILPVGINSAAIHYGTLPGYAGAVTLTFFPTGFDSWTSADIGAVGTAGSASYLNGAYTVSGSGADIWNSADAFQFVEQPLVGDGAIIARG